MNPLVKLNGRTTLSPIEEMILQEMAEDTAAFDVQPARITIAPGGINQFVVGEETAKSVEGIVILSQKVRAYWPAGAQGAPLCHSNDGVTGVFSATDDESMSAAMTENPTHPAALQVLSGEDPAETWRCATCPLNQWGSGRGGRSKACKEMRRLLILPDGWTMPALMTLPPTSIRAWDAYCSSLAAKRSAYFAVKTRFELEKAQSAAGEPYSVVKVMKTEDIVDPEILKAILELRREYKSVVSGPIEDNEYKPVDTEPVEYQEQEIPF